MFPGTYTSIKEISAWWQVLIYLELTPIFGSQREFMGPSIDGYKSAGGVGAQSN